MSEPGQDTRHAVDHIYQKKDVLVLVEALQFYVSQFEPKPNKKYGGLEYKPTEDLLDDCGNKALDALSLFDRKYGLKSHDPDASLGPMDYTDGPIADNE